MYFVAGGFYFDESVCSKNYSSKKKELQFTVFPHSVFVASTESTLELFFSLSWQKIIINTTKPSSSLIKRAFSWI